MCAPSMAHTKTDSFSTTTNAPLYQPHERERKGVLASVIPVGDHARVIGARMPLSVATISAILSVALLPCSLSLGFNPSIARPEGGQIFSVFFHLGVEA